MSRAFDGVDDQMVYAVPASGINVNGAHTLLIVCRIMQTNDGVWQSFIETETSAAGAAATIGRDNTGALYWAQGVTLNRAITTNDSDNWIVAAASKTAGLTVVRLHKGVVGGANTHTDGSSTIAASASIASGTIRIGGNDDFAQIRVAAAAIFTRVLSDAELNGVNSALTTQSIYDLTPVWLVDDADAFATDYMNNADRTSITGTSDNADDPAGWVYGVGGGVTEHERSATMAATAAVTVANRQFFTIFTRSAALASTAAVTVASREFFTTFSRSAAIASTAAITAAPQRALQRAAAISATAAVTASGTFWTTFARSAALAATGAITAVGRRDLLRQATLDATAAITAIGQIEGSAPVHERAAAITAVTNLVTAATFWSVFDRTVTLAATGNVASVGQRDLQRSVVIAAVAAIDTSRQVEFLRAAAFAATASITATGEHSGPVVSVARLEGDLAVSMSEGGTTVGALESGSSLHALIE